MNNEENVSPDLEYLKALQSQGHRLTDCFCVGLGPTLNRMTIYCADGSTHDFTIDTDHETLMTHYREVVQFTEFGPRGLANMIYADACDRRRLLDLGSEQVTIIMSPDCQERIGEHLKEWTYY